MRNPFLPLFCILCSCYYQVHVLALTSDMYSIMGQLMFGGFQQNKWDNTWHPSHLSPFLVWPISHFNHKPDPPLDWDGTGRNLVGAGALQLCIISDESPSLTLQHEQKKSPCFSGLNIEVRIHFWLFFKWQPLPVPDLNWIHREESHFGP